MLRGLDSGLFGAGFLTIVQLCLLGALVLIIWRGRAKYVVGTPIVLKTFRVDESPDAQTPVEIVGRSSGIISWVFTLLKIQSEIHLVVSNNEISIRYASLSGLQDVYIPLGQISATVCGFQRSILAFAFAVYFSAQFLLTLVTGIFLGAGQETLAASSAVLTGLGFVGFGYLVFAAIAALVYFLSKRIGITIETAHLYGIAFKKSVIENVSIDMPEATRAIGVINSRVLAAQTTGQGNVGSPAVPRTLAVSPQGAGRGRCPRCSTVNPIGTQFCENCGSALPARV